MTTRDMIIARYPKPFIERMQAMIEETNTVNKSRMVAAKDEMLELLRANNGSYTMKLKPKEVACHYKNRDGAGLSADGVLRRGAKVVESGCSLKVVRSNEPVCFEDNPETQHIEENMLKLVLRSPKFARYCAGTIKVGSVSTSHFNHFLAAAEDEVPCDIPSISATGNIDKAKVCADVNMALLSDSGIEWTVIKWDIKVIFPTLPTLLQEALNVPGQIAEGDEGW